MTEEQPLEWLNIFMIIHNVKEAVKVLLKNKPLVIFQKGASEWGPRALGRRSILFDPRKEDAKYIVNKFKGREYWRPTAGTVLLEHASKYFEMGSLKESPYMSFAIDAKERVKEEAPAIVHADGTCRVQTLKEDDPSYYNLINEFYLKTKVPIILNTSFNLAGFPIVESENELQNIMKDTNFKDIYIP